MGSARGTVMNGGSGSRREFALYRDPNQNIDIRTKDLLARMTLREKVSQLGSVYARALLDRQKFSTSAARGQLQDGIGQGQSFLCPSAYHPQHLF